MVDAHQILGQCLIICQLTRQILNGTLSQGSKSWEEKFHAALNRNLYVALALMLAACLRSGQKRKRDGEKTGNVIQSQRDFCSCAFMLRFRQGIPFIKLLPQDQLKYHRSKFLVFTGLVLAINVNHRKANSADSAQLNAYAYTFFTCYITSQLKAGRVLNAELQTLFTCLLKCGHESPPTTICANG
jgi:hypothetical protein